MNAYYKQMDGIRAFAVLGPIMVHLWPRHVPDTPYTAAIAHLGSLGVDLFFVISGFLITGILLSNKDRVRIGRVTIGRSLATFYLRRAVRIFPIYYLLLFALLILGMEELRTHGGWYFAYLANLRIIDLGHWPAGLSHLWSLSVEEQFYLVWPLLVLGVPDRFIPSTFITLFCAAPVIRVVMAILGTGPMIMAISPFTCLDPLAGGALLALWMRQDRSSLVPGRLRTIGAIGGVFFLLHVLYYVLVLKGGPLQAQLPLIRTSATLFFMWVIGSAALERTGAFGSVLLAKPVAFIGRISYGIYLYHLVVPWVLTRTFGVDLGRSVLSFAIVVIATICTASLSWFLIEKPANRLKHRFPN
jgi:peptidoglycan/LPS O-acetylase OafA/YrhL